MSSDEVNALCSHLTTNIPQFVNAVRDKLALAAEVERMQRALDDALVGGLQGAVAHENQFAIAA